MFCLAVEGACFQLIYVLFISFIIFVVHLRFSLIFALFSRFSFDALPWRLFQNVGG